MLKSWYCLKSLFQTGLFFQTGLNPINSQSLTLSLGES